MKIKQKLKELEEYISDPDSDFGLLQALREKKELLGKLNSEEKETLLNLERMKNII